MTTINRVCRYFNIDRIYFFHFGMKDRIVFCDYKKGAIISIKFKQDDV